MKNIRLTFLQWIPFGVVVTLLCMVVYGAVQQTIRSLANNPQIQMAKDGARFLATGEGIDISLREPMDISKTLSPFVIIFDNKGKPIDSHVTLDGEIPIPPIGVFENAKIRGENRLTWQPRSDVRIAMVLVNYNSNKLNSVESGFVLAGRSLRESEQLCERITFDIFVGWMTTMIISFIAIFVVKLKYKV